MIFLIIIFVLYSIQIVNSYSYNNIYSGYSNALYSGYFKNSLYSGYFKNSLYSEYFKNSGYSEYFKKSGYSEYFKKSGYSLYSNIFNSNLFSSYKNCLLYYSKNSNQNYLSLINSYNLQNSNTHYSLSIKSIKEIISNDNWGYISLINSYNLQNSKKHYSNIISFSNKHISTFLPTQNPTTITTFLPTQNPTLEKENIVPILSFETYMTLSGLTEPSLDTTAQTAVVIAVASSINISTNQVLFLGQEIVARRRLIISQLLSTYNIKAITQINIPLTNQYNNVNPSILYTSLTTNLATAISNGNFITFLLTASIALNSTSTQNVVVSNYSVSQMVLTNNNSFFTFAPTLAPSFAPTLAPTLAPTFAPTLVPTLAPTLVPTLAPTLVPTLAPTLAPSFAPTLAPTLAPTFAPTLAPSYNITLSHPTKDISLNEILVIVFASMGGFIAILAIYIYVKIKINKREIKVPLSIREENIILTIND